MAWNRRTWVPAAPRAYTAHAPSPKSLCCLRPPPKSRPSLLPPPPPAVPSSLLNPNSAFPPLFSIFFDDDQTASLPIPALPAVPFRVPLSFPTSLIAGYSSSPFQSYMLDKKPTIGLSWAPKVLLNSSSEKQKCMPQYSDSVWKRQNELVDGLFIPPADTRKVKKLLKKQKKDTTGQSWFDLPAPTITPELRKDLQILKLRSVIDPKRHYKKGDSKALPKYFQVGTVVESASDFFSGRLTKKERKQTLAEELLSDRSLGDYRKRKVREIEDEHQNSIGAAKWKNKGRQTWKRAKQRRH